MTWEQIKDKIEHELIGNNISNDEIELDRIIISSLDFRLELNEDNNWEITDL